MNNTMTPQAITLEPTQKATKTFSLISSGLTRKGFAHWLNCAKFYIDGQEAADDKEAEAILDADEPVSNANLRFTEHVFEGNGYSLFISTTEKVTSLGPNGQFSRNLLREYKLLLDSDDDEMGHSMCRFTYSVGSSEWSPLQIEVGTTGTSWTKGSATLASAMRVLYSLMEEDLKQVERFAAGNGES